MILMLFISIALMLYSLFDFKKSVYVSSIIVILQAHLSSGIPGVKFYYLISIFQLFLFGGNYKNIRGRSKTQKYPMLLLIPCVLAFVGYMLSSYWGVCKPYAQIIVTSVATFLYPIVLFKCIKNKTDLVEFLSIFIVFFLIVGIYTLVEELTGRNFYSELISSMGIGEGYFGGVGVKMRYGLKRCNSILAFSSTLGLTASFAFFVFLYMRINRIFINRKVENLLLVLLPICVLLTGTRSSYVVFVIAIFPFLLWGRAYQSKIFRFLITLAVVAVIVFAEYWGVIIDSILDSNEASTGSSLDMREAQLDIALYFWQQSPIWGFGKNYITQYVIPNFPAMLGAESIWFRMLVDYGGVGCVTYLLMCIGTMIWVYKYDKRFIFIPLAFLAGKTISIVVGIEISYLLITSITLYKIKTLMLKT